MTYCWPDLPSIGEKLGSIATEIKAAGIDDSQKDLTELAKLNDKAPEQVQKIEFMQAKTLTDKGEKCQQIVDKLPENEGQIRPLLTSLKTDSERIKVWQDAVFDSKGNIQQWQQQTTCLGASAAGFDSNTRTQWLSR